MPGIKTHDRLGRIAALPSTVAAYIVSDTLLVNSPGRGLIDAIIVGVGVLFGTYMLSPDLDCDSAIHGRWGWIKWIWAPYKVLVRHRSYLSHSGLSALIRLGYLYGALRAFLWLISLLTGGTGEGSLYAVYQINAGYTLQTYPLALPLFAAGVVIADLVHTIADRLSTGVKRLF